MLNKWRNSILGLSLVILTFPEWYPALSIGIDPSCAWLYNYLLIEQPQQLANLIFPHGLLDFLQSPLPMGYNLELALTFDFLLRILFAWSGLQLVATASPKRYWAQAALLGMGLALNRMDVLLFATSAHFILLALQKNNTSWLLPAALLSTIGLMTKTAIGLPSTMMLAATVLYGLQSKEKIGQLLGIIGVVPATAAIIWLLLVGNANGFLQMIRGTLYLIQGNSSAVCHYPPNNWIFLSLFWLAWISWPIFLGKSKTERLYWGLLSLPLFAFWKYGIARQDIWHLYTSYRAIVWTVGTLLVLSTTIKSKNIFWALLTVGSFYLNLRSAEGFVHFDVKPVGLKRFYEWTFEFQQKKQEAIKQTNSNLLPQKLPDSIRNYIGTKTVDIFPWHYTYAAINQFNLQPRHIPQSYAAYHPWLDQLDASFFHSEKAPEILLFHLKAPSQMGQLMGIDDRYLLQDAPKTLLAIADHYKVIYRHPNYLVLERSTQNYLLKRQTFPYSSGWTPPKGELGIALLKIPLQQSLVGKLKSLLYKSDPVLADVYIQHLQRRIKLVPALAEEGVWIAPWMEEVVTGEAPFLLPDSIKLVQESQHWTTDTFKWQIEWIEIDTTSGFIPNQRKWPATPMHQAMERNAPESVPADGFSSSWKNTYTWSPNTLRHPEFALTAFLQAPLNAGCSHLVMSVYDSTGTEIAYQSTEYCGMGIGSNTAWPVSLKVDLPSNLPSPFEVKVYIWNPGKKEIQLKKLEVWTNCQ
jgi:hypothetical protein